MLIQSIVYLGANLLPDPGLALGKAKGWGTEGRALQGVSGEAVSRKGRGGGGGGGKGGGREGGGGGGGGKALGSVGKCKGLSNPAGVSGRFGGGGRGDRVAKRT